MRTHQTKAARDEFVTNWYRTVAEWQKDLEKTGRA